MANVITNKFYHVFSAGKYPQGEISLQFINNVAKNYDKNFHEAPVWIGHPSADVEPEALGWIEEVKAEDGKLYVSFSDISDELKELTSNKKFKKCSVELVEFSVDGKIKPYLYAIGLTNRPAVKGLPDIKFSEKIMYDGEVKSKTIFTNNINFQKNMNEAIKKFAEKLGINISEYNTDESVLEYAANCIGKLKEKFSDEPDSINSLSLMVSKYTETIDELKNKISDQDKVINDFKEKEIKFKDTQVNNLLESAVLQKKITPAQKESLKAFAVADFDNCKKYVDGLPEQKLLEKTNFTNVNLEMKKVNKDITYEVLLDEVKKNPKFANNFTEEEIIKMKESSKTFGK